MVGLSELEGLQKEQELRSHAAREPKKKQTVPRNSKLIVLSHHQLQIFGTARGVSVLLANFVVQT
jgi:hypothetical protein